MPFAIPLDRVERTLNLAEQIGALGHRPADAGARRRRAAALDLAAALGYPPRAGRAATSSSSAAREQPPRARGRRRLVGQRELVTRPLPGRGRRRAPRSPAAPCSRTARSPSSSTATRSPSSPHLAPRPAETPRPLCPRRLGADTAMEPDRAPARRAARDGEHRLRQRRHRARRACSAARSTCPCRRRSRCRCADAVDAVGAAEGTVTAVASCRHRRPRRASCCCSSDPETRPRSARCLGVESATPRWSCRRSARSATSSARRTSARWAR